LIATRPGRPAEVLVLLLRLLHLAQSIVTAEDTATIAHARTRYCDAAIF
jgi:hypothetical protein